MNHSYTIIEVQPEWRLDQEQMGSKRKFWYSERMDLPRWLFKYAREINPGVLSGEHWAEKIAEQVAEKMGILHAKVELAVCQGSRGSTSESFVNKDERTFVHGNEILSNMDVEYESSKNFRQTQHTLERIFKSFDEVFEDQKNAEQTKCRFAEYLVLDALISNVDRHHENWGILMKRVGQRRMEYLAPSFDHASSLGRELTDARRQQIFGDDRVESYVGKGHGAIFWEKAQKKAPPPLNLVQLAAAIYPAIFQNALKKLDNVTTQDCETVVDKMPAGWMSPDARLFAQKLLCYNLGQLKNLRDTAL